MKKIIVSIVTLCAMISFFASCQKDVEIWDSATLEYSGRYVIRITNEDMSQVYLNYDNSEVQIYNTASNMPNEMWIEDTNHQIPLKSKFSLTGTPASFKSTETVFDKLTYNLPTIVVPPFNSSEKSVAPPTALGQTKELNRDYLRATVMEGKIIPEVVTTKGGNKADSLYLKVKLYGGTAVFKSILKPEKDWKNPTIQEFSWIFDSVKYDPTKDEVLVVSGHRYTGFKEDQY